MRVLVVEDDKTLNTFTKTALTREGFAVDSAFTGKEGLELARSASYDIVLMDVMMPEMDGFTLLKTLRKEGKTVPVLMLTSQGQEKDKLVGFNSGADDYLVKPFLVTELVARIRAILKRAESGKTARDSATVLVAGGLRLDLVKRRFERKGKTIELTKKEFELLEYFMRRPGQVLSQSVLAQHVWNMDFDPGSNVVEVQIKNLRDKISGKRLIIENVRGAGYRFTS
jgi:DNA-binding response OmpR family regulator